MHWTPAGAHDVGRMVVPSVEIETWFRMAPVPDPKALKPVLVMVKCLGVDEYLKAALQLLIDEGFLQREDSDGNWERAEYEDKNEIQEVADRMVSELIDRQELAVTAESWEWLRDFHGRGVDADIAWFHTVTLEDLTRRSGNLEAYVDLTLMIGPRSLEDARVEVGGAFWEMVNKDGQLMASVKAYFYPNAHAAAALSLDFLRKRLADFLLDTQWPTFYRQHFAEWDEYTYDLPRRAAWKTATRAQWPALVAHKLKNAIVRHFESLHGLFEDLLDDQTKLVREVQLLGDTLLPGVDNDKLPLLNLDKVEEELSRHFGDLIAAEREEGKDTAAIQSKLSGRIKAAAAQDKNQDKGTGDEELVGPKPGQMRRAQEEKCYAQLDAEYTPPLQEDSMSNMAKLNMFKKCFTSGSVLPIVVLLAPKGARLTVYVGTGGTDFLALLYAERYFLAFYLGQSLAYDPDVGKVPKELETFTFNAKETEKLRNLLWETLDPLNGLLLELRGAEVGTTFAKYSTRTLYHDAEMLTQIQDYYGRMYESIGYPKEIPKEDGESYRTWMGGIKKIQKSCMALPDAQQSEGYSVIDNLIVRGNVAAAANARRVLLGGSPADRKLWAWLRAEEPVVIELRDLLSSLEEIVTFNRRTAGMFAPKAKAAKLPGYAIVGSSGAGSSSPPNEGGGGSKKAKKRAKSRSNSGGGSGGSGTNAGGSGGGSAGGGKGNAAGGTSGSSSGNGKGNAQGAKGKPGVGAHVEEKRIIPYDDGTFSICATGRL